MPERKIGGGDTKEQLRVAQPIASALGEVFIREGFDLVLTGTGLLNQDLGRSAVAACKELGVDPSERVLTYRNPKQPDSPQGFGTVVEPSKRDWQEVRTSVAEEADAVVALMGGMGTSDVILKAALAKKPVFPIAVAGGAAQKEWERLTRAGYCHRTKGDLLFLADKNLDSKTLASKVAARCKILLQSEAAEPSRSIFIVHGHDAALKNELARFLQKLDLDPVILHERPDRGTTIIDKLLKEIHKVGFAFVLLTPDDLGSSAGNEDRRARARQNVVFEYGLLVGALGPSRVCAIVKEVVEIPSDLQGLIYKQVPTGGDINAVAFELIQELKSAGYNVNV